MPFLHTVQLFERILRAYGENRYFKYLLSSIKYQQWIKKIFEHSNLKPTSISTTVESKGIKTNQWRWLIINGLTNFSRLSLLVDCAWN